MTYALIALTLAIALLAHRLNTFHDHLVEHIDRQVKHLEGVIAMSQQDAVNDIVAKLSRAKGEILGRLAELQGQIDAGVPTEQLDLTALTDLADSLDNIVADEVVVPEGEVVPVDPPADEPVE